MQLTLMPRQPLKPWPDDTRRYVAALQNRRGELDALHQVADSTWEYLTPLIQVVGHLKDRDKPYSRASVRDQVRRVYEAVGQHPVYLDVIRLDPRFPVDTPQGKVAFLEQMFLASRKRGLVFVPVAWVGESSEEHLEIVRAAVAEDQRGAAVRYRFLGSAVPSGQTRRSILARTLDALSCEPSEVDLLLDLEDLGLDDDYDEEVIAATIDELVAKDEFRSVVLLGTTIPRMMSCIKEGSLGALERREWTLWQALRKQAPRRMPAFGDYAVQHPQPPLEEGGGNTMRANVRYTVSDETLVARGIGPVKIEGRDQYRGLCQMVMERDEFCGSKYSWGDSVIADCAVGLLEPGAQRMWRGAGTSHHLRFVTKQLRSL